MNTEYVKKHKKAAKENKWAFVQLETDLRHLKDDYDWGYVCQTGMLILEQHDKLHAAFMLIKKGLGDFPSFEEASKMIDEHDRDK